MLVVENRVAAQRLLAAFEHDFVAQEALGIALVLNKPVGKVLTHPLLGSQGNILLAEKVEDFWLFPCSAEPYVVNRQVQFVHFAYKITKILGIFAII